MNRSLRLAATFSLGAWLAATAAVTAQHTEPGDGEQRSHTQRMHMRMPDTTTFTVTAEDGVPEIPFRLINNHLILSILVNASGPVDAVLDTGMPTPGLALYEGPRTRDVELDFDPSMQVQVAGAGGSGGRLNARMATGATLELEGLIIRDVRVIALPEMDDFGGYHNAIIGYSLFERFVVELDYDRRIMRLHEPASFEPPSAAHVLPLIMRNRLPFVSVLVTPRDGEAYDAEVVVDLGASHAISLNTDSSEAISIPEESLDAVLGHGLSGPVEGKVGRLAALELAGARLADVLASFPIGEHQHPRGMDSRQGNLGSDVLRRFTTIFDYSRERMILVPNRSFSEPFEWDHSGLKLGAGRALEVVSIVAGSPAEKAGIQVGDVLTHVDGSRVGAADYGTIRDVLTGDGEVDLTFERSGKAYQKTIKLRRMI